MNVRSLKERLRAKEHLTALIVKMPAAAQVQMAAAAGFHFVVIDLEHGVRDTALLETDLRAAHACGLPALVRLPHADAPTVLGVLDAGATGIVVPHVGEVATAEAAVAAAHYPPRGRRSFALTTPAGDWGATTNAAHLEAAAAEVCVVVQIEDENGVAAASAIAAVASIDALFIGLNDLALDMVGRVAGDEPTVRAAADAVIVAARMVGKPTMTVVGSPVDAVGWRARGAQIAVFVAPSLMLGALRAAASVAVAPAGPGDALPLVLLPGMLEDARLWEPVAERLCDRVRLVPARIDLDQSIAEMAETVLAMAPPRFALAGHSLGGIVALEVALRAPGRVARLALLQTSGRAPGEEQLMAWSDLEQRLGHDGSPAIFEAATEPMLRGEKSDAVRQLVVRMATDMGREVAQGQLMAQCARQDMLPRLGDLRCPTLVLSGELDHQSPAALQEELAAAIPGAHLRSLAGCGHLAPLTEPNQTAAALAAWLDLGPQASDMAAS